MAKYNKEKHRQIILHADVKDYLDNIRMGLRLKTYNDVIQHLIKFVYLDTTILPYHPESSAAVD